MTRIKRLKGANLVRGVESESQNLSTLARKGLEPRGTVLPKEGPYVQHNP